MRRIIISTSLMLVFCCVTTTLYADSSASLNCGECNSGNFTVMCQCHDAPPDFHCTSCTAPPNCSGVGCCCGVNTKAGKTFRSSFTCAGSGECFTQLSHPDHLFASISALSIAAALFQGGEILNSAAPVQINTAKSGIRIANFKLQMDQHKLSGATFDISNASGKSLVAYAIGIDFYWDIAPNKPCHATVSEDSWFLNGAPIGPGEQEPAKFMTSVVPHQSMRLVRVVVNLEYAEFSDGSVAGQDASAIKAKFDAVRREELAVQNHYTEMLQAGTPAEQVANQIEMDLTHNKYKSHQLTALVLIEAKLKELGPTDLAQKLLENPAVPLRPANP
jgi:hypothetical protein